MQSGDVTSEIGTEARIVTKPPGQATQMSNMRISDSSTNNSALRRRKPDQAKTHIR